MGLCSTPRTVFTLAGVILAAATCDPARPRPPTDVTTTSFRVPRPEQVPAATRTVDASGFVDNGGRFAEERARTEMSGLRATEMGSSRITGTPGSGLPLPIEPRAPKRVRTERRAPDASAGVTTAADAPTIVPRIAEAACDREMVCGRVGEGRPWPSAAACVDARRVDVREELAAATCLDGYDRAAVARCLSATRAAPCDVALTTLLETRDCVPTSICIVR